MKKIINLFRHKLAIGRVDDSFYAKNIKEHDDKAEIMLSVENEIVDAATIRHDTDLFSDTTLNNTSCKMYYISDIHLNHKLLEAFPTNATEPEVREYIRRFIKKMLRTVPEPPYSDYLLVAGDISFNFEISTLFYTELVNFWYPRNIVVVLGNHELWDFNQRSIAYPESLTLDEIIQQYRDLFSSLNIRFLQNDLLFPDGTIITEKELEIIEQDTLKHKCLKNPFAILGGLGFSGLNEQFNATNGIYRQTVMTLDDDMKQTYRFNFIYNKVKNAMSKDKVVILTHTPKENWSNEDYNSNWIYVNGHTHRNNYACDEDRTFYADNQLGYKATNIGLKYFRLSNIYDVFKHYDDGIYSISRAQYLEFNRGVGIRLTFNRDGIIHMLKNHGLYCFILQNKNTGKKYLLSGGQINVLKYNDINHYFENMVQYSDMIKESISSYNLALKAISSDVKKIGGSGKVHGCIIDIDWFNHIYLNPVDGTITPYSATSMVNKYIYPDIKTLFLEERKDLYDNYMKLLDEGSTDHVLLECEMKNGRIVVSKYVPDTQIYKLSRIMKSLQYLTEANVIRSWDDSLIESQTKKSNEGIGSSSTNNMTYMSG